ncbi:GGDEF domain-containing protein [Acetobacteraceae bacterium H6797]|nr:GGDEF domain-containing protein [Acetobacteraceae bacterium H6797]
MNQAKRQRPEAVEGEVARLEPDLGSGFSLFDREEEVLRRSAEMLRQLEAVAGGVGDLATAYRKGYREQQRLVRLSDRMQNDLQRAKARLAEQARDLQALNKTLAAEVQHRTRLETELRLLLETDSLTGAKTRRRFLELAEREVERHRVSNAPCVVILLDLDRFKSINDRYGHAMGDEALRGFVQVSLAAIGPSDFLGRLGGEEFALMMPDRGMAEAQAMANAICEATRGMRLQDAGGERVPLSVSIGVAELAPGESLESVMRRADLGLYEAKRLGRGRVALAPGPEKDGVA